MPEQDNRPLIEKLLGENWRTSFWAIMSGIGTFIAMNLDVLTPLPDYWEDLIKRIISFLVMAGLIKLGISSADINKSKQVSTDIKSQIDDLEKKTTELNKQIDEKS